METSDLQYNTRSLVKLTHQACAYWQKTFADRGNKWANSAFYYIATYIYQEIWP